MALENEQELTVGDRIVYRKIGAYSMTLGGPFIRYYPEVYVENENGIQKVRSRMTVDAYYNAQI